MPDNSEFGADPDLTDDEAIERARINSETSKIAWQELQRFFAQGHAIYVSPDLDLVDVAWEMSRDSKEQLEAWMDQQGDKGLETELDRPSKEAKSRKPGKKELGPVGKRTILSNSGV